MSDINRARILRLIAWIVVLPFLAFWPFLSALPAFSLLGRFTFDLTTSLNVIFLLTGCWALSSVYLVLLWLTRGKVRQSHGYDNGLLVGGYAVLWTCLYTIAAIANR